MIRNRVLGVIIFALQYARATPRNCPLTLAIFARRYTQAMIRHPIAISTPFSVTCELLIDVTINTNFCQKFVKNLKSPASFPAAGKFFLRRRVHSPIRRNTPTRRNPQNSEKTRRQRGAILATRETQTVFPFPPTVCMSDVFEHHLRTGKKKTVSANRPSTHLLTHLFRQPASCRGGDLTRPQIRGNLTPLRTSSPNDEIGFQSITFFRKSRVGDPPTNPPTREGSEIGKLKPSERPKCTHQLFLF